MSNILIADFEFQASKDNGLAFSVPCKRINTRHDAVIEDKNYLVSLYITCSPFGMPFELMPASILFGFAGMQTGDDACLNPIAFNQDNGNVFDGVARPFITNVKQNGIDGFIRDNDGKLKRAFDYDGCLNFRFMAVLHGV